jgi:MoxR-like ATPase
MSQTEDLGIELGGEVPERVSEFIARIYPHIARLINVAANRSSTWVTREELINELLLDSDARKLINNGASGTSKTIRSYAGNTIDWWSADFTKDSEKFKMYREHFKRTQIDDKYAYWPTSLGPEPRIRKVWINNASWLTRNEFEHEIQQSRSLHWNLWPTQMLPYQDIEKHDLIVTSWNETRYRKRGKLLGWVVEVDQLAKSEYESQEDAYEIMKSALLGGVSRPKLTKRGFLQSPYNEGKPSTGFILAYTATPKFLLNQPRPEEINLSSHGWRSWTETELQRVRFESLAHQSPRIWQVNNNKTAEWETASGLLFAPLRDPQGKKRAGYEALKDARPGDIVYSMFDSTIGAKGVVVEVAKDVQPEQVLGDRSGPGYELRVSFQRLKTPFKPKEFFDEISEMMDPERTQLTKDGAAVQSRYFGELAESHRDVYESIIDRTTDLVGADRHLLVRLSNGQGAGSATITAYRSVLQEAGQVALIEIGKPLTDKSVDFYSRLLDAGKRVSLFLLTRGDENALFEAELAQITNDPPKVDTKIVPDFHKEHIKTGNTCFVLRAINPENLYERLDELLVLHNDPASRISESLKGQQSVMSVLKTSVESTPRTPGERLPSSDRARRLARQLSWEESKVEELLNGLERRRPQIVLAGPPGTGKTYCASAIARALLDDIEPSIDVESNIHVVQFHPTYSYQEFMEGLQPKPSGSSFMFDWVDGVLKRIVNRIESARKEGKPSRNILIIDEINRANVPSVLGELMYLLEYRNKSVTLGSGKSFALPDDLIIIGTMNSADRSIRGLDLALRRRFDFFDVVPDARVLRDHFAADGRGKLVDMTIDQLVTGFDRLNQQIEIDSQSSDLMIGHSYLMEEVMSRQVLERVWRQQLFPLIREYFLGSADLIGKYSVDKFWNV